MAVNELIKLIWTGAHLDISKIRGFGKKTKKKTFAIQMTLWKIVQFIN
jgi:hypothetical protein